MNLIEIGRINEVFFFPFERFGAFVFEDFLDCKNISVLDFFVVKLQETLNFGKIIGVQNYQVSVEICIGQFALEIPVQNEPFFYAEIDIEQADWRIIVCHLTDLSKKIIIRNYQKNIKNLKDNEGWFNGFKTQNFKTLLKPDSIF